jgi:hypothetical protein
MKSIAMDEFFHKFKKSRIVSLLDRLSFFQIFVLWNLGIILFGLTYFVAAGDNAYLYSPYRQQKITNLLDHVYFSFITATSTGSGEIVPIGLFKFLTIIEVVFGLLLLAIVTSKIVSIKQDAILSEVYEMSFNEKMYRFRSSLLLFRQNLGRTVTKIEDGSIRRREISDLYTHFSALEDILHEILSQLEKQEHDFAKSMDPLNTQLIFISINQSFEKVNELIDLMHEKKLEWKRDIAIQLLRRCININHSLFGNLNSSKRLPETTRIDLGAQNKTEIDKLVRYTESKNEADQKAEKAA